MNRNSRSDKKKNIITAIVKIILECIFLTIRVRKIYIPDKTKIILAEKKPVIFLIWHHNILSFMIHFSQFVQKKMGIKVFPLISNSKDGEYIAGVSKRFGIDSIRGSSSKGGAIGALGLIKKIKQNHSIFITPDGPRGPAMEIKEGTLVLASKLQIPIITINSKCNRFIEMKSWDKHILPKFFSTQTIFYSEPILIDPIFENKQKYYIETLMNNLNIEEETWKKNFNHP